jgi:hypothetical protein
LAQFRTVLDMYDRLRPGVTGVVTTGTDAAISALRKRMDTTPETLWWSDFEEAELCIIAVLSEADLRARALSWRGHFHDVVGDAQYALYLATTPTIATMTLGQVRADVSECIRQTYYYYGAYGVAARSRSSVTKALFLVATVVLVVEGLIALLFALNGDTGNPVLPISQASRSVIECLLATSAAAVLGSVVSVQRRLQDPTVNVDPYYRFVQTTTDWFGIAFVSPIFGAIFGLLIYGLLAAKLIGNTTLITFDALGRPAGAQDLATLLILGFLAGFAEQLIPDTLTRIASRALGTVTGGAPPPPIVGGSSDATPKKNGVPANAVPAADAGSAPAKLTTAPADITDEARALGHDASLASEASGDELKKGLLS